MAVYVEAIGTGNWTLTIHDSNNNVIATKTIPNASMSTGLFEFIFDTQWRPLTNFTNTYHFHVTSTVADGTVRTGVAADLSTVTFKTYFQFLVNGTWHMIGRMLQFLFILNERYVATIEATLFEPNRIVFPAGWSARCYGYWNEYLAIGCTRGESVTEQDDGIIFFWDGISSRFNFSIPVPEGGINALLGSRGELYVWAGYQGDMLVYRGGTSCEKIRRIPKINKRDSLEIYPSAVCMWKGYMRFGVAGSTTSTDIQQGIYTYGKTNFRYIDALTYDYPISTGRYSGTDLQIGLVLAHEKKLLIGWKDGLGCGIDYVDDNNDCYSSGMIEFEVDDGEVVWKEKRALTLIAKSSLLESGQSMSLRYKKDDEVNWTINTETNSSSSEKTINRMIVTNPYFYEIQYGLDIYSTSGESPTIKGIGFESDPLQSEGRM